LIRLLLNKGQCLDKLARLLGLFIRDSGDQKNEFRIGDQIKIEEIANCTSSLSGGGLIEKYAKLASPNFKSSRAYSSLLNKVKLTLTKNKDCNFIFSGFVITIIIIIKFN
jgi:hypothetical protein